MDQNYDDVESELPSNLENEIFVKAKLTIQPYGKKAVTKEYGADAKTARKPVFKKKIVINRNDTLGYGLNPNKSINIQVMQIWMRPIMIPKIILCHRRIFTISAETL